MEEDIRAAAEVKVDGVVLGVLSVDGSVDQALLQRLMALCTSLVPPGLSGCQSPRKPIRRK